MHRKTWPGLGDEQKLIKNFMCFLAFNLIAFSDCARKMNQNVDSLKGKCIDISIEKYFRLPDPATFSRAIARENVARAGRQKYFSIEISMHFPSTFWFIFRAQSEKAIKLKERKHIKFLISFA